MAAGHLYILLNASFARDVLKIGMTTKDPVARARELSTTGVPTPFVVAYSAEVFDCATAEKALHARLDRYRTSANREFFELPLKTAIQELDAIALAFVPARLDGSREVWTFTVGRRRLVLELLDESRRRFRVLDGARTLGTCAFVQHAHGEELLGLPADVLTDDELGELEEALDVRIREELDRDFELGGRPHRRF